VSPSSSGETIVFEKMNHGGELARAELVEQVMGVLPVSGS
jgi:hypothetical protein